MGLHLTTGQGIRWCLSVIHHQAINSKRRYMRWERDKLTMNRVDEDGSEWGESVPCTRSLMELREREATIWMQTALTIQQYEVLYDLYVFGLTQSELAKKLQMSQQHVSRIKESAVAMLRKDGMRCEL